MQGRRQGTASRHKSLRISLQRNAQRAWFQINLIGPTAAKSIVQSIRDAVDLALRTTGRRFRHQTIPAGVAGAMHVEKGYAVAFAQFTAVNIAQPAANLAQPA